MTRENPIVHSKGTRHGMPRTPVKAGPLPNPLPPPNVAREVRLPKVKVETVGVIPNSNGKVRLPKY